VFFAEGAKNESTMEESCQFICISHLLNYFTEYDEIQFWGSTLQAVWHIQFLGERKWL
jgi:hypothetical protein